MQPSEGSTTTTHPVITALRNSDCAFCEDGKLTEEMYKGNTAVVCDNCGTPGAQIW
ncbi:HVO_A0556 family zinc finger protein [Natronolimnohabitans sp. A-GB9]|uniref:HVO_A0556 family zinc finger protein n=1 Tax=Natronolimnohabitans sp. A-GB9 TaxID=3069757 RepID=UPI0027B60E46|nr:HVO_A0556 family zinc finger protein [Natronolimnohabitans sp. A-GB9]MDQ2052609.1 HVO_A0556 family zinc finger protein [Natronolimnohabitans sp. A-GB9]